jgi:hypothetical protein
MELITQRRNRIQLVSSSSNTLHSRCIGAALSHQVQAAAAAVVVVVTAVVVMVMVMV